MSKKIKTLEQLEELRIEEQQAKLVQLQIQLEDCFNRIDCHLATFLTQSQPMLSPINIDHYIRQHQQHLQHLNQEKDALEDQIHSVREKLHFHYKKQKQYAWLIDQYDQQQQCKIEKKEQYQMDDHGLRQFLKDR